ncbi:hypothetical protein [Sphingomonas paeninsulae]|nr:hypothetical protein [Sphingomonas paeninsulae]
MTEAGALALSALLAIASLIWAAIVIRAVLWLDDQGTHNDR